MNLSSQSFVTVTDKPVTGVMMKLVQNAAYLDPIRGSGRWSQGCMSSATALSPNAAGTASPQRS